MRFEKVSKEAFIKDCKKWLSTLIIYDYIKDDSLKVQDDKLMDYFEQAYENISVPVRSTSGSAGYDFKNPFTTLTFTDRVFIPTGIRIFLDKDKILQISPRSSASKKGLGMMLANTIGIIDSDYVNADNECDIIIEKKNLDIVDSSLIIDKNEKIAQGIIIPFYTVDDDTSNGIRTGGFGSTGK